jgi:hypothetical protein
MANTFKMVSADVGTSFGTVYTAPSATTAVVIGFTIANVHASTASYVTAKVVQSGGSSESILINQLSIGINDSFNPIDGKLVLETGDYIQLLSENASSLELTLSYLEIT